jgi:peptide/nickel transport system permease protein
MNLLLKRKSVASPGGRTTPGFWRYCGQYKAGTVSAIVLLLLFLIAVFAPLLAPFDPTAISIDRLQEPGVLHWFGTDNVGADVFSGILYGTRVSLAVGVLVGIISLFIGVVVGSISGYYGGWIDGTLMRIAEFVQVIPRFFLAILIVAFFGGGVSKVILVIGLLSWPTVARIIRAQFLAYKEREVVESAHAMGFGSRYIIMREILPNALPPGIVQATLDISEAILLEAGLSFFGLGSPDVPSWGQMLNAAQPYLMTAWWMSIFPGLAVFVLVMAFNVLGDTLNDILNPGSKSR